MEKKYISVLEALIENDHLITTDIDDWLMIDFDIEKNHICGIYPLTDFEMNKLFWCEKIIHTNQSYYFIYRNCMRIKEFNTETMKIYNYGMDNKIGIDDDFKYRGAFVHGNEIYMLPGSLDEIIWSFNIDDKSFHNYGKLKNILNCEKNFVENQEIRFFCMLNEKYWFGIQNTKKIGYVDLSSELRGELMTAPLEGTFDNVLSPRYFSNSKSIIFKDDRENLYCYKERKVLPLQIELGKNIGKIRNIIPYKNKWIIMTDLFDGLYIFSLQGDYQRKISFPKEFKCMPENRCCNVALLNPVVKGENCYISPLSANGFIKFNMETEEIKWIPVIYDRKEISMYLKKKELLFEDSVNSLQYWLGSLMSDMKQENPIKSTRFTWNVGETKP